MDDFKPGGMVYYKIAPHCRPFTVDGRFDCHVSKALDPIFFIRKEGFVFT